ncbi:MAG: hypothetical protein NTX44_05100 [Ignavibacteriales bacterium]|nr:hypothetical protein [Ignavibacteriales bacterium]
MQSLKLVLAIACFTISISYSQVLQTSKGQVEFIGLSSWSPQKLLDTLSALEPDKPFGACAADLRFKLGFPDASVCVFFDGGKPYTIITVVEPSYSSLVKYKEPFRDTLALIQKWSKAFELFNSHQNDFFMALQFYPSRSVDTIYSLVSNFADSAIVREVWNTIEQYNSIADQQIAFRALRSDGNHKNRLLASAVLANFFDVDSTWWELSDALRDPDGRVSGIANSILLGQAKTSPRTVDWYPVISSLRSLLDGTNLFAFTGTLEILTNTRVSPKLAIPLLRGGGNLLLAYLKANRANERQVAHRLLVQLANKDYGFSVESWKSWIVAL